MPEFARPPLFRRRGAVVGMAVVSVAALGAGLLLCHTLADSSPDGAAPAAEKPARSVVAPTAGMAFDYQIGGAYPPPAGTEAVARDRGDKPAEGLYNVCYVNAFQAQPDALDWWEHHHPDLLLRDDDGRPVTDEDWDEALLDTSTAAHRAQLAEIVGGWIDGCAAHGFQAVEPDNLDSYERAEGGLSRADNAAFARLLARRAHSAGLAIGQKNTADLTSEHAGIGFDFAVAEECGHYDECGTYAKAYADRVFVIEYSRSDFDKSCSAWGSKLSVVNRDIDVRRAGRKGYVFRSC
ncbi:MULTISPECIES: endo alpha-1,4 polygalactosaminidase [unclassified Streptomyces]|uniref:endo alpha-1,4 polygalactosaminidase n=1 Tax=unclassified Streptomyces TaxID=2593676 RepID=UPI0020246258|nr:MULTISPECIES: endo alpha-1,4 polygalactosaminidase [unclassified Streptomyces]WSC18489.1 endo alpha-1,4 polygalactosaminidase [Streptomyces sp. NBC_01766]WSV52530.1 endo alpha-1,4 polygalactosaminidase [Streptomyces sp. NBC_01014]